eukprot:Polyplicarium_translucidae@DN3214_c0_g1_i1.p1
MQVAFVSRPPSASGGWSGQRPPLQRIELLDSEVVVVDEWELFCSACNVPAALKMRLSPCFHVFCASCAGDAAAADECPRCHGAVRVCELLPTDCPVLTCFTDDCFKAFTNKKSLDFHSVRTHGSLPTNEQPPFHPLRAGHRGVDGDESDGAKAGDGSAPGPTLMSYDRAYCMDAYDAPHHASAPHHVRAPRPAAASVTSWRPSEPANSLVDSQLLAVRADDPYATLQPPSSAPSMPMAGAPPAEALQPPLYQRLAQGPADALGGPLHYERSDASIMKTSPLQDLLSRKDDAMDELLR